MSKSILDLHMFLDDLSDELNLQRRASGKETWVLPFLSIEIFNDKSWRIHEHIKDATEPLVLLNSEDMDNPHHNVDVYDLLNISPASLAEKILEDQSVANITREEL